MFQIQYSIEEKYKNEFSSIKSDIFDESDARYYFFWGSICLKISEEWDNLCFEAPLLDFANCLLDIINSMENGAHEEEFEFTENTNKIFFEKEDYDINIYANFSGWEFSCNFNTFKCVCFEFINILREDIKKINPKAYIILIEKNIIIE